MTFNEQLERALDKFSGRLREDVARQVRVVGDELAAAASAEAFSHAEAASRAEATSRAEAASRVEAAARAEAASRAEAESRAQAAKDEGEAVRRLADGVRAFEGARSLSDILDTLVRSAGQEASRVSVLLVRGDHDSHYRSWRLMGFGPSLDSGDPIEIAAADAGVIAQAASSATLASAEGDNPDATPKFAQLPPGRGCVAIPLVLCGQVVAVLYADGSNDEPGTLNLEPLEILCRHAGRCLEALTAIKAARSLTARPEPQPTPYTGR